MAGVGEDTDAKAIRDLPLTARGYGCAPLGCLIVSVTIVCWAVCSVQGLDWILLKGAVLWIVAIYLTKAACQVFPRGFLGLHLTRTHERKISSISY